MPRIIVKFREGTPSEQIVARRKAHDGVQRRRFDRLGKMRVIELPEGADVDAALADYNAQPEVELAYRERVYKQAAVTPNDTAYSDQWALPYIGMPAAWELGTGASNIVVAILDGGMWQEHVDVPTDRMLILPGCNIYGPNEMPSFPDYNDPDNVTIPNNGHALAMLGTLAAEANNSACLAGVDWGCQIMPVVVLGQFGSGTGATVAEGIEFAVDNGAHILSMSLYQDGVEEPDELVEAACAWASAQGCLLVACSGNEGTNVPQIPAAYDSVLSVGSIDSDGDVSSFSCYGDSLDLTAPGNTIRYLYQGDSYPVQYYNLMGWSYGTSFSVPYVVGAASLVLAANPNLTPADAAQVLKDTAVNPNNPGGWDQYYGWGVIDVEAAMTEAIGTLANPCTDVSTTVDETGATTIWTHDGEGDVIGFIVERARNWAGDNPSDADYETVHIGTDPDARSWKDTAVRSNG